MTINCVLRLGDVEEDARIPCEVSRNKNGEDFKVVRSDTGEDITEELDLSTIRFLEERLYDAEVQAKRDGDH